MTENIVSVNDGKAVCRGLAGVERQQAGEKQINKEREKDNE